MSPHEDSERRYEGRVTVPDSSEDDFKPMLVIDEESCSAYIYLVPAKAVRSLRLSETAMADLDASGAIVGVELVRLLPEAIAVFSEG
jgi:uncharacterized protein YuzE